MKAYVLLRKLFFTKTRDFSRIRYKIGQYFNSGHAPLTVLNFVCCLFPFIFSRPFYSGYLLRCMFFLAAVKSWMLIMGEA